MEETDQLVECSICGRVGGPYPECDLGCQGQARFIQKRHFTLTEERAGLNPDERARRYSGTEVGPQKVVGPIVLPRS